MGAAVPLNFRFPMNQRKEQIRRAVNEEIDIVDYDPLWPSMFISEREHLRDCLPTELIGRIEHFGSTAVPGLAAKPVIDMLVEVTNLAVVRRKIVPILEAQGYDYFWRPSFGDIRSPYYAWFIKRDESGRRTHHIHMIEKRFAQWDGLLFRDYLIKYPDVAREYETLKRQLSRSYPADRAAYTIGKGDFVRRITEAARREFRRQ